MKWRRLSPNQWVVLCHDALMVIVAWFLSYWLRFNLSQIPAKNWVIAVKVLPIVLIVQMLMAVWSGCYRGMWRFASLPDLMRILKAIAIGTVLIAGCIFIWNHLSNVPRAIFPLYALLLLFCWGGPRLLYRVLRDHFYHREKRQRVLIIGAGQAGEGLVRDLLRDPKQRYEPVAFLDNDKRQLGRDIQGIPVAGTLEDLKKIAVKYRVVMIMLALPLATAEQMQALVMACDSLDIPYRTLPSITDLTENRITINALRHVDIEDLLGRDLVDLDWGVIGTGLQHKVILVTGAGGSIGSELCRQIARQLPKKLILLDHSEFNLYQISQELAHHFPTLNSANLLVDVSDVRFVKRILEEYRPHVIFHAAAYKHVPMLEDQLLVAVKNNIFATRVLADLAVQYQVASFVLVSSDKAVNPTNIMGLSKRVAELYCQNLNVRGMTQFITVRFGNVLGSTGSVVPLFRKQLEMGGPLTVTHPDMTRYFMTIPEATSLILQAYSMGQGGEIFVLDMGAPIKITYLAEQMIRLSGREPYKDIAIEYTGIRPGEKLFEELFHGSEQLHTTKHHKISLAQSRQVSWVILKASFDRIEQAYSVNDSVTILEELKKLVPEYCAS